jgi:hypothetical protein
MRVEKRRSEEDSLLLLEIQLQKDPKHGRSNGMQQSKPQIGRFKESREVNHRSGGGQAPLYKVSHA